MVLYGIWNAQLWVRLDFSTNSVENLKKLLYLNVSCTNSEIVVFIEIWEGKIPFCMYCSENDEETFWNELDNIMSNNAFCWLDIYIIFKIYVYLNDYEHNGNLFIKLFIYVLDCSYLFL